MFRSIGLPEITLVLVVVVLLFGAKRLPETARGLGRSLRILKAETKGLHDDDAPVETRAATDVRVQAVEGPREATGDAPRAAERTDLR